MSDESSPYSATARARAWALAERPVSADEAREFLGTEVSDEEHAEMLELIRWFLHRYPTPAARLAYGRSWTRRLRRAGYRKGE